MLENGENMSQWNLTWRWFYVINNLLRHNGSIKTEYILEITIVIVPLFFSTVIVPTTIIGDAAILVAAQFILHAVKQLSEHLPVLGSTAIISHQWSVKRQWSHWRYLYCRQYSNYYITFNLLLSIAIILAAIICLTAMFPTKISILLSVLQWSIALILYRSTAMI